MILCVCAHLCACVFVCVAGLLGMSLVVSALFVAQLVYRPHANPLGHNIACVFNAKLTIIAMLNLSLAFGNYDRWHAPLVFALPPCLGIPMNTCTHARVRAHAHGHGHGYGHALALALALAHTLAHTCTPAHTRTSVHAHPPTHLCPFLSSDAGLQDRRTTVRPRSSSFCRSALMSARM